MHGRLAMVVSLLLVLVVLGACAAPQAPTPLPTPTSKPPSPAPTPSPPSPEPAPETEEEPNLPGCPEQPEGQADPDIVVDVYDPEVQPNGNILAVSQWRGKPHKAIEINPETGEIVWEFAMNNPKTWPARDANRLPNGNTLITGTTEIVEVMTTGEVVWRLKLKDIVFDVEEAAARGFYKAERICQSD